MLIRKALLHDIDTILALRDAARRIMRMSGNLYQWAEGMPSKAKFEADIEAGVCQIVEKEGVAVATFSLLPSPDPTYAKVYGGCGWKIKDGKYGVIHRLASDGTSHGVFEAVLEYAKSQYDDIRIDTHEDNAIMRHCLAKYGFTEVGTILLQNSESRLAFQWLAAE